MGSVRTRLLVFKKAKTVKYDLLLGMNILKYANINLANNSVRFAIPANEVNASESFRGRVLTLGDLEIKCTTRQAGVPPGAAPALAVNHVLDMQMLPNEWACETPPADMHGAGQEAGMDDRCNNTEMVNTTETPSREDEIIKVHLREELNIKANTVSLQSIKINRKIRNGSQLLMYGNSLTPTVLLATVVTKVTNHTVKANLINLGDVDVKLKQGTEICLAESVKGDNLNLIHVSDENIDFCNICHATNSPDDKKDNDKSTSHCSYEMLGNEDVKCSNNTWRNLLMQILNEFRVTCWLPGEPLGLYKGDQLEIRLKEPVVVNKPPYRIAYFFQDKLNAAIKAMLKEGIISKSKSSYNSPLIIVKRADGEIRPCIDYRGLNQYLQPVSFPLPRISDVLNALGQSTFISTLDLASAYHQCSIRPCDREKTAFTVNNTKFHFNRVPFGLASSPAFFARIINHILFDLLGPQCMAYMDDIIIYSKSAEQHLETIRRVLEKLTDAGIKIKIRKCHFFAENIKFLGYCMTQEGMTMDEARVRAIKEMPVPSTKKQVQSLLGALNYYRMFVPKFAEIAEPLYALLRKNAKFSWTPAHTNAVQTIKNKLASAPIIKFPNFEQDFHIYTDASNQGIAGVLMQKYDDVLHPVAYVSKTMNGAQKNYAATKKEALALVFSLEQFRHIILHFPVHVYTDHIALLGALRKPTKDECLQRWALLIQEYDIQLHYVPGCKNVFADCLSRLPDPTSTTEHVTEQLHDSLDARNEVCNVLQDYIPEKVTWTEDELRTAQREDPSCMEIVQQIKNDQEKRLIPDRDSPATKDGTKPKRKKVPNSLLLSSRIINGILYINRKINHGTFDDEFLVPYVPDGFMPEAFKLVHTDTTAGHSGPERTFKLFSKNFYNRFEKKTITDLCDACELCLQAKRTPKQIPISKYPIPIRPFSNISSDILGPLRMTEKGNQYVLTIRDFVTRYTILFPLTHKSTDAIIDALRQVISHYGSSNVLVTDNAAEYKSEKLNKFLQFYNTKKTEIAPYHPASQGLSERINREINKLLRIYTNQLAIHDWDVLLPVLQLTINNTYNSSIKETPFFALFGYDGNTEALAPPKFSYSEDELTQHQNRVAQIREHCRQQLLKSQDAYTDYTNSGRKNKDIAIGHRVFAKLDKYRTNPRQKLDLPISGPFEVTERRGKAWVLKELATQKVYIVHPDLIVTHKKIELVTDPRSSTPPTLTTDLINDLEINLDDAENNSQTDITTVLPPANSDAGTATGLPAPNATEIADAVPDANPTTQAKLPRRIQPPRACKK